VGLGGQSSQSDGGQGGQKGEREEKAFHKKSRSAPRGKGNNR
jgi:hypothetical protein